MGSKIQIQLVLQTSTKLGFSFQKMQIVKETKRNTFIQNFKKKSKNKFKKWIKKISKKHDKRKQYPTREDIHIVNNNAKENLVSKFTNLKSSIFTRILEVDRMEREQYSTSGLSVVSGNNPKRVIESRGIIHDQIKIAIDEWNELKNLYHKEIRKHKSRMTKDDLEAQYEVLMQLRDHINNINDESALALDDCKEEEKVNTKDDHNKIEEKLITQQSRKSMELMFNQEWWNPLLDRKSLKIVVENDKSIHGKLTAIDGLVSNLKFIANTQAEEVNKQNEALSFIDYKMAETNIALRFVNKKVKDCVDRC